MMAPISDTGLRVFLAAWRAKDTTSARAAIREHALDHPDLAFHLQGPLRDLIEAAATRQDGRLTRDELDILNVVAEETCGIHTVRPGEGCTPALHEALVRGHAFDLLEAFGTDARDQSLYAWSCYEAADAVGEDACEALRAWCDDRSKSLDVRESQAHARILAWYAAPGGPDAVDGFARSLHHADYGLARAFLRAGGFSLRDVHMRMRGNEVWNALAMGIQHVTQSRPHDMARNYLDTWLPRVVNRIAQRWKGRLDDFGVAEKTRVRTEFVRSLNDLHALGCESALRSMERIGLRENVPALIDAWVETYVTSASVDWLVNRWRQQSADGAQAGVQTRAKRRALGL